MLQITGLSIRLAKNLRPILDNFTFSLASGDRAALIGEEGNGKSTLLRLLYSPTLVEGYAEWSGEISRGGARIGYLAQELTADEQKLTPRGLAERCAAAPLAPGRAEAALARLGLNPALLESGRAVGTLSGGEKVKLRLAALMASSPDLLLLDEPTNDLDLETMIWLEGFINSADIPIMYVSHDETLLENTANIVIHMEQLRKKSVARCTISRTGYADYASRRGAAIIHAEQVASKEREEHEQKLRRWQQIFERVQHEQNTISRQDPGGGRLLKKKMHSVKSQQRRFQREEETFTEFPEYETAICLDFPPECALPRGKLVLDFTVPRLEAGGRLLAENVRVSAFGGEHIGITGRNGCGKTTLLRLIAAELLPRRDIRAAYMPQNYAEGMDFAQTPVDYLCSSSEKSEITRVRTFLGSARFEHEEMLSPIGLLSGGQKAKLMLLKAVLSGANVLLLDEPTRNFSPLSCPVIRAILADYRGTIIAVTHDRKLLAEVCARVIEL